MDRIEQDSNSLLTFSDRLNDFIDLLDAIIEAQDNNKSIFITSDDEKHGVLYKNPHAIKITLNFNGKKLDVIEARRRGSWPKDLLIFE